MSDKLDYKIQVLIRKVPMNINFEQECYVEILEYTKSYIDNTKIHLIKNDIIKSFIKVKEKELEMVDFVEEFTEDDLNKQGGKK